MEQQQSTVCYIHVMHIAYIALFICTLVHLPCILGFVSECDHNILFWQVLGTCRWRIFRRPGIFWRTITAQGSHLTLWDTQLSSSLQVYILILEFVIYMYGMCVYHCVLYLVLMTWGQAWPSWSVGLPTDQRDQSPLSNPTSPPPLTVWKV